MNLRQTLAFVLFLASVCLILLISVSLMPLMISHSTQDTGQIDMTSLGDLALMFKSDHSRVKMGATVRMQFTITNTGKQPMVIEAKDRPVLDIVVSAMPNDEFIRSWSAENPDKVLHRVELKPGDSQVLDLTWTVSPGDKLGIRISLSGIVNSGSTILHSAGVMPCLEGFCSY